VTPCPVCDGTRIYRRNGQPCQACRVAVLEAEVADLTARLNAAQAELRHQREHGLANNVKEAPHAV
jgi:ferredoxin